MSHRFIFTIVVFLAGTAVVFGDDWPQFRGPAGDGLYHGALLPLKWSGTQHIDWKVSTPGLGWSSPIIVNGRIYLTTAVPVENSNDLLLESLCLDSETGNAIWEQEVFRENVETSPKIHSKNSHASPTPLIKDGRLYVHFGHQGTACLDLDGNIVWRNVELNYAPNHGNGGSPIIVDDKLVFNCDGSKDPFVVALDIADGAIRWKTLRTADAKKKFSFGTPTAITVNGQTQIISPGSEQVCAYDPATGKEIWQVRYDGYSVVPKPVYGDGLVFVCTGFESPTLLAIRPTGQGDVTDTHVAWTEKKAISLTPSPLLVGDELYLISDAGIASCLDVQSGKVHWRNRIGGNFSASPSYADGRIYLQSEDGVGTIIKAGKDFKVLATNPLGERTLASYALVDGAIFIRSEDELFRIGGH